MEAKEKSTKTRVLVEVIKSGYITLDIPPVYGNMPNIIPVQDELVRLFTGDCIDLSQFELSAIRFNSEDADLEWQDVTFAPSKKDWPNVRLVPFGHPLKLNLSVTANIKRGHTISVKDVKEELAMRLLASDGQQHLETMNTEPNNNITFTVAGCLPKN